MMEHKGGFERIYPPEEGVESEPYKSFMEHASESLNLQSGNDFIRSRGYSKTKTETANSVNFGSV